MILLPVLSEQVICKKTTIRDVTTLPISAEISSVAGRLLGAGLSTEEVEDDIIEIFDFLEDCSIRGGVITITPIGGETNFQWPEDDNSTA